MARAHSVAETQRILIIHTVTIRSPVQYQVNELSHLTESYEPTGQRPTAIVLHHFPFEGVGGLLGVTVHVVISFGSFISFVTLPFHFPATAIIFSGHFPVPVLLRLYCTLFPFLFMSRRS